MTESNDKCNKQNLTRIPQNFNYDIMALDREIGLVEATILKDIMVFLSFKKFSCNLFGEIYFTLSEFCEEFGYSKSYLQRNDPNRPMIYINGHQFDGLFEYVLYLGLNRNITFRRNSNTESYGSVQIFSDVNVLYDRTKKNSRREYCAVLGPEIMAFLFTSYNLLDFADYRSLSNKSFDKSGENKRFLMLLSRFMAQVKFNKSQKVSTGYVISVDDLCSVLGIPTQEARYKKTQIKRRLDSISQNLETTVFSWKFVNNGAKYKYFVEFNFPESTLLHFDENLKARFLSRLFDLAMQLYSKEVHSVSIFRKGQFDALNKKDVLEWFLNFENAEQSKIKIVRFLALYNEVYGQPYNNEFGKLPIQ